MKATAYWFAVAVGMALRPSAEADLFDNFDDYADNAAFASVWTPSTGTGLVLNSAEALSGPNSVKNPGTSGQSNRRPIEPVAAPALDFSFSFYDYYGGSGRDYVSLYSRAGTGDWSDSLNNVLSIGKYDAVTAAKYSGRMAIPGEATFGDGAFGMAGGWFALGGAPDRSIGWHSARITGEWDALHSGKVRYSFYIDGVLGGSVANAVQDTYNWVVLGSGLTTVPSGIAVDDLSLKVVPEPAAFAFLLLGMAAWHLKRRR